MRYTARRTAIIAAIITMSMSCGGSTEPLEDIPAFVGSYCATSQMSKVTRSSTGVVVDLFQNVTKVQRVTRRDGSSVSQEVRSCKQSSCSFIGGLSNPDSYFLTMCQQLNPPS